jgi:hypothetical protein
LAVEGVTPVGEQGTHGGGVPVAQLGPVEGPGVAPIVAQQAGDGIQRSAHGAPRRRREPGQVHGDRMAIERDFVQHGELVLRRVDVVGRRIVVSEPNRGRR